MNTTQDQHAADDPRLLKAVQEYLAVLEAGGRPDRNELVSRYPDLGTALAPYLDALDAVHAVAPLRPASSSGRPGPIAEPTLPAEALGDFRIVREIGRGGMGVVYEAVQRSLGRRVALKVLPFAAALDAKQLQRFKNEAQAAAYLHHPHIVPVYAVGTERGVHFYAMQLIEGQNLAALIEDLRLDEAKDPLSVAGCPLSDNRQLTSNPGLADTKPSLRVELTTQRSQRSNAYFRTMARLVMKAAEGLDYAHGLGIVHRDVKPGNLLLDGNSNIWVTDFGLAQFQADAGLTQTGDMLGTLRYMSPEQAGGQRTLVDQRTDVYSLGATLYELLTLLPIFAGTDRQALLQQILHDEPVAPRSIDASIPTELDTIVLKAVAKSPADRYATAREFADDLQRFLDDRPIRARPPSLVEKATKWARRHRAVVVSAVVALLFSVAGLSVATMLTARAYDRERQKVQEAEESFRQARSAVDQFVQISEEELARGPGVDGLRKRLLEAALTYYQGFIDQRRDDPSIQKELETSRAKVESILGSLTTLMGMGQYWLLQDAAVQADLELENAQREAIGHISASFREAFRKSFKLAPSQGEASLLATARKQENEVAQLLKPVQLQRLKQLALQERGPLAFSDPEVATSLGLTPEQKKRIREIQFADLPGDPDFEPPPGGPPPDGPPWGPRGGRRGGPPDRFGADREQVKARIVAMLTPDQKQKWQELTGKPFEGRLRARPPGPFGHGRMGKRGFSGPHED